MSLDDDIAKLQRAINSGQKSVQFNGRRVELNTPDEMRTRLKELELQKLRANGGQTVRAVSLTRRGSGGW